MSLFQVKELAIHQTLHGYSRGHRLLAASRKLSPETERELRLRSDYTGSSRHEGFEAYLTVYPLQEERCIAFARTWYAKEMRRPGCVWTQTLLLPDAIIDAVEDFASLLGCFRRPSPETVREYEQVVQWTGATSPSATSPDYDVDVAALLLSVYCHPDDPVFLASQSSERVEHLVLSLWSQQWPALRKEFTFCTGLLEIRGKERLQDIQVVPTSDPKLLRQSADFGIVVSSDTVTSSDTPNWLNVAANDIFKSTDFRSFLHRFADKRHHKRRDFSKYSRVFCSIDICPPELAAVVRSLVDEFPDSTDASELKRTIVGKPSVRTYMRDLNDIAVLKALVAADSISLDPVMLEVGSRFQHAWPHSRGDAMSLLREVASHPNNALYSSLVEAASYCIDDKELEEVVPLDCNIVLSMLNFNFRLSSHETVWSCEQCSIDALTQEFRDALVHEPQFTSEVIGAQLKAGRGDQIERMEQLLAEKFVACLLDVGPDTIRRIDGSCPSAPLRSLKNHSGAVLAWLAHRTEPVNECDVFAGHGLRVGTTEYASDILRVWTRLCPNHLMLSTATHFHAAALVLAAAFDQGGSDGEAACCVAFPLVYAAVSANSICAEDWNPLRARLPRVGPEWDRCRTLRSGLIEQCVRLYWSEQTIIQCTKQGPMLQEIFESWGWEWSEKNLLKSVAHEIDRNPSTATSAQIAAAARYVSRFWT